MFSMTQNASSLQWIHGAQGGSKVVGSSTGQLQLTDQLLHLISLDPFISLNNQVDLSIGLSAPSSSSTVQQQQQQQQQSTWQLQANLLANLLSSVNNQSHNSSRGTTATTSQHQHHHHHHHNNHHNNHHHQQQLSSSSSTTTTGGSSTSSTIQGNTPNFPTAAFSHSSDFRFLANLQTQDYILDNYQSSVEPSHQNLSHYLNLPHIPHQIHTGLIYKESVSLNSDNKSAASLYNKESSTGIENWAGEGSMVSGGCGNSVVPNNSSNKKKQQQLQQHTHNPPGPLNSASKPSHNNVDHRNYKSKKSGNFQQSNNISAGEKLNGNVTQQHGVIAYSSIVKDDLPVGMSVVANSIPVTTCGKARHRQEVEVNERNAGDNPSQSETAVVPATPAQHQAIISSNCKPVDAKEVEKLLQDALWKNCTKTLQENMDGASVAVDNESGRDGSNSSISSSNGGCDTGYSSRCSTPPSGPPSLTLEPPISHQDSSDDTKQGTKRNLDVRSLVESRSESPSACSVSSQGSYRSQPRQRRRHSNNSHHHPNLESQQQPPQQVPPQQQQQNTQQQQQQHYRGPNQFYNQHHYPEAAYRGDCHTGNYGNIRHHQGYNNHRGYNYNYSGYNNDYYGNTNTNGYNHDSRRYNNHSNHINRTYNNYQNNYRNHFNGTNTTNSNGNNVQPQNQSNSIRSNIHQKRILSDRAGTFACPENKENVSSCVESSSGCAVNLSTNTGSTTIPTTPIISRGSSSNMLQWKSDYRCEVVGPPACLTSGSKWDQLSTQVWQTFQKNQQIDRTFIRKLKLKDKIYRVIRNVLPYCRLYIVGSSLSGFGADTSDVDMCLMVTPRDLDQRKEAPTVLNILLRELNNCGFVQKLDLIRAKVPILKFRDAQTHIDVDLNCNNSVGIRNTHLLNSYSQLDWRVRPLVLVVKLWAQYHEINNAKDMTISSYSLVLMVIHFLQVGMNPPVLPCLQKSFPDKFRSRGPVTSIPVGERMPDFTSNNKDCLGELFLGFLDYYANNFTFIENTISVRTGGILPTSGCRYVKTPKNDSRMWKYLCIEEPFDLTNTARSVYDEEVFEHVKKVFTESYKLLKEKMDLESILKL